MRYIVVISEQLASNVPLMRALTCALPYEIQIIVIRSTNRNISFVKYICLLLTGVIFFLDNIINFLIKREFIIAVKQQSNIKVHHDSLSNICEFLSHESFRRVRLILLEPLSLEIVSSLFSSSNMNSIYYVHGRNYGNIVNECLQNSIKKKLFDLEINISRIQKKTNKYTILPMTRNAAIGSRSFTLNLINSIPKVIGAFVEKKANIRRRMYGDQRKYPGYLNCLTPYPINYLKYFFSIVSNFSIKLLLHVKRKRDSTWSILLKYYDETAIIAPRQGHMIADPFVVEDSHSAYIFTEDFDLKLQKNCIALYEYRRDSGAKFLGEVVKSESWLSCPCIYKLGGDFYMICDGPGTDIITYKCAHFPLEWVPTKSIMVKDFKSESHFIIFREGYWFLFLSPETFGDGDFNTRLDIYYTSDLVHGSWRSHPSNPVFIGSNGAKTGGLYEFRGEVFRTGRRVVDGKYGYSIRLFKITELTPTIYNEEVFVDIDPKEYVDSLGCIQIHHLHRSGSFVVIDFMHPST